ncbi:uncharacterized protein LOC141660923 [Apium graveolens]|uniref:uncharacterized protein LOC141660923 n=1 Tax=Apium graveolens TaxID=4045 RepID=UPI003D7A31C8
MPLYPEVGGSEHSDRGEAQGRTPQYIRGLAPIPEDQEFSGPHTERDSESSDDDVAPKRRRAGKEPMADTEQRSRSTQGMNPQDVQESIRAHETEIQRLKRDLETHLAPRPPLDLSQAFIKQFISGRVHEKSSTSLMGIVQGAKESLREYLNRFTKETLKVPDLDDKVAMIALQQGTRDEFFKMSLAKRPPESMLQLQDRAGKYIKVEESMKKMAVSNEPTGNKKRKTDQEYDANDKYPQIGKNSDSSSSKKNQQQTFAEYARLNAPRSQILMEIEKDKNFKWPKPLRGDPEKRDKNRYCRYHKDVGHDTDDCRQLKDEIKYLFRRGKFGRFTKGEEAEGQKRDNDRRDDDRRGNDRDRNPQPRGPVINMISGGPTVAGTTGNSRKAYTREVMSIVGEPSKRSKSEMTLEFGDPDLEGLKFPQDDPLVITPIIGNCPVMRVLVDNGASMDILFHDTFIRMGYNDSQLTPSDAPIYWFNHVECKVEGAIQLLVTIGEEPKEATQMLNFQVVKAASTYNAIMGRIGIHAFKAVPSTYHMVLKFPTRNGVGEARGDQKMTRNCYVAVLKPDGTGEDPEKVTYIGASLDKPLKGRITTFLQENRDVFAWTEADMPGIDPNLITHRLNVDPTRKAVKQKKRIYAPDRLEAIKQQVEKLLEAGFIEEVQFHEWIDTLIDPTAGHEMLSFMDGFSGYNQIRMHKDDTPKVSFITDFGVFCYLVMAFGLKNAGATYQRLSRGHSIFVLAVSEQAVSVVLVKEEQKLQKPVYYVSKVLHRAELNYSTTEKFALALITASRKLRPYFQAHKIENLTGQPLRNILHSPKASGRLIKWAIELGEFDIKYKPRTAIKAQALADFVVEYTINDQEVGGGAGLVLQSPEGFMIEYALKLDFPTTNNEAEYEALTAGLGLTRAIRAKNLKVCGDSRLVVAQVNGEFEAKDDTMAKYLRVVKGILTQFDEWYTDNVLREVNTTVDALSQFASSEIENYPRSIYFQVLKTTTIHVINLIAPVGVASCWIDPIKTHLETGWLPDDAQEARKLSVRALRYSLIEGLLYKRSFVISYLKCLRPLEAKKALKEAHEGIYGQHLEGRALTHKITRLGFYWPTMLADTKAYMKKCDRCERHAPIVRQPPERLTSISTPIPFEIWGMDILGPFPVASGQRKFILVAIDYFTKWIEAKALAKITTKQIAQFFWENANGQVEVANRIILDELKKRVECSKNTWVDELLPILWAYRTTCKVTTEATPFMLAYRAEAVVPLKITHGSPRIEAYEPETNEEGMRLALDLIDKVRDEANARNAEHQ